MGILKNQTNLKQIHLSKIHSKWKNLNLSEFKSLTHLSIHKCGYISLKGLDKYKGKLNLDEEHQKRYKSLKSFKKFKGKLNWKK